jgi:hypothetical protein
MSFQYDLSVLCECVGAFLCSEKGGWRNTF